MKRKFKTYEAQAQLSAVLAVIGGLAFIAAAVVVFQRFDREYFWVRYSSESLRQPVIGVTLLIALAASVTGFFVALNSAGQRRNERSKLSWTAFFVNAGIITLTLCLAVFFMLARYTVVVGPAQQ